MKGIVQVDYAGIESLQIKELPEPKLTPVSVIVAVRYVPVLPSDIRMEVGEKLYPRKLPAMIGLNYTGVITAVGALRDQKLIGQKVMGITLLGSAKERLTAMPFYQFRLPNEVSLAQAATLFGGADTALMVLQQSKVPTTANCLVIGGSGGVGQYLVQLLRNRGNRVTILASERSASYVKQQFPNCPVASKTSAFRGDTFDYVFDTAGQVDLLHRIERTLVKNGLLFSLVLPDFQSYRRDIRYLFKNNRLAPKAYRFLIQQLATGTLRPAIDSIYSYKQVKAAQRQIEHETKRGRTLLTFDR